MNSNRPHAPLFATINITGVCNLKCKYCFFQPRLERHMPLPDFRRTVDDLAETDVFFINISGGEPFTHPDVCHILRHAHDSFQHVVVLSNGTLLRPRHLETISAIVARKGGFPIQISLDSVDSDINRQTRSSAGKILRNLRTLNRMGADIVVAIVVSRFNAETVIETISRLSEYIRHFHIMTVQKVNALNDEDRHFRLSQERLAVLWSRIAELKNELGVYIETPGDDVDAYLGCAYGAPCMAGFSHLVIDPDMKVRPCDRCVETFVGDLSWQTLPEIWSGSQLKTVTDSPIAFCRRDDQRIKAPDQSWKGHRAGH